jgi:hypothetical protein
MYVSSILKLCKVVVAEQIIVLRLVEDTCMMVDSWHSHFAAYYYKTAYWPFISI